MQTLNLRERKLTDVDFGRLSQLNIDLALDDLDELLGEAEVMDHDQRPPGLVTLGAPVDIEDVATRRRQRLVICHPGEAAPKQGYVSVLSPVGMALLGLQAGATGRWRSPSGEECAARVLAVLPAREDPADPR
jgi:regulator of nucleoside diphosphate kinase